MYIYYCKIIGLYKDTLDWFSSEDRDEVWQVAFKFCSKHSGRMEGCDTAYHLLQIF